MSGSSGGWPSDSEAASDAEPVEVPPPPPPPPAASGVEGQRRGQAQEQGAPWQQLAHEGHEEDLGACTTSLVGWLGSGVAGPPEPSQPTGPVVHAPIAGARSSQQRCGGGVCRGVGGDRVGGRWKRGRQPTGRRTSQGEVPIARSQRATRSASRFHWRGCFAAGIARPCAVCGRPRTAGGSCSPARASWAEGGRSLAATARRLERHTSGACARVRPCAEDSWHRCHIEQACRQVHVALRRTLCWRLGGGSILRDLKAQPRQIPECIELHGPSCLALAVGVLPELGPCKGAARRVRRLSVGRGVSMGRPLP